MTASIRTAGVSDSHDIAKLTAQLGYGATPADVEARLSRILARPESSTSRRIRSSSSRAWSSSVVVSLEFPHERVAAHFECYLRSGSGRAFAKRHFAPIALRTGTP